MEKTFTYLTNPKLEFSRFEYFASSFLFGILKILKSYKFFFFLLFSVNSFAQIQQTAHIEFERLSATDEEHVLFPLQENGAVLMHSKMEIYKRKFTIDFHKYDSTLAKIWTTTFEPEEEYELVKTFDNHNFLYVLLKKDDKTDIGILRIDFETGDKTYVDGNLLTNMDIEEFKVLKSKAFIGGKYNDRPVVVMFSLFDKTSKVLPELHANSLQINELDINEHSENVYVMLKNERNCEYIIKMYSYEGKMLSTLTLGDRQKTPISGRILDFTNENQLLTGSYSEGCSLLSLGFYLHQISEKEAKPQYFSFADFNNFFSFMNEKREAKIKSRIKNKKMKGKEVKLRYRLLLHEIIPTKEGWMIVAEIFYPEYKSPNNTTNTVYGNWRSYRIGNELYNNFRYTHAIVCSFDKNGKLLWDNSVSLNNLENNTLHEKVQLTRLDEKVILAYPDEGKIKTVIIQGNQRVKTLENFTLKGKEENERITDSESANLAAWYGHSFLAYGYQSIKKENAVANRDVFYINKLTYTMNSVNLPNRQ